MPRHDSLEMGELTDSTFYILLSLVEPKHGYLIMQSVEEMTLHNVSIGPASMYTIIKKLLTVGLIEHFNEKADDNKKTYITTAQGIDLLVKEVGRRKEMIRHAEKILDKKERLNHE